MTDWHKFPDISAALSLLEVDLVGTEPIEWRAMALSLDTRRVAILRKRCDLYKELVMAREQMRVPNYKPEKDEPRLTDLDRRTMMEANTAQIQADYELIKGLEKLVQERVELLKILLKGSNNEEVQQSFVQ